MRFKHKLESVVSINDCLLVVYDVGSLSHETDPKILENVQFFDSSGNLLWTVNSRLETAFVCRDAFVGVFYSDGDAELITFGSHVYKVDLETGKLEYLEFVK